MAQNSKNQFYIHDESLTTGSFFTPAEYAASSERSQGFVPNTSVSSKQVNTALLETTFAVTGIVESLLSVNTTYSANVNPSMGLTSFSSFFVDSIKKIKVANATHSDASAKVDTAFTVKLNHNTTGIVFDGSSAKTITIYAATSSGTSGQVLKSNGTNSAPTWVNPSTLTVGSAASADKVANALTITLNGTDKVFDGSATKSASFYAPTSVGTSGQILKSNGSGAPSWANQSSITAGSVSNSFTITFNGSSYAYNGSAVKSFTIYAPTTAGTSGYFAKSNGSGAPTWQNPDGIDVRGATKLKAINGNSYSVGNSKKPIYFSNGEPSQCDLVFDSVGWSQHQDNLRINGNIVSILAWSNGVTTVGWSNPTYTTNSTSCPWDTSKSVWMRTWYTGIGNMYIVNCYLYLPDGYVSKDDYAIRMNVKNLMNARYGSLRFASVDIHSVQVTPIRTNTDGQTVNLVAGVDFSNGYVYVGLDNDQRFAGAMITVYCTAA